MEIFEKEGRGEKKKKKNTDSRFDKWDSVKKMSFALSKLIN